MCHFYTLFVCDFHQVHRLLLASDGVGTQVVNEQGVYQVCMYVDGRPQRITVDDYIATKPHGGPIHIHSLSGDSWSMLVEKAFAKVPRLTSILSLF